MRKDAGHILIEFNNAASRIFYTLSDQLVGFYERDRSRNEHLVRLQFGHFTYILKCRLDELAENVLKTNHSDSMHDQLSYALASKVNYYLHQFRSQATALG